MTEEELKALLKSLAQMHGPALGALVALAKGAIGPESIRPGGTLTANRAMDFISLVWNAPFFQRITTATMKNLKTQGAVLNIASRSLKRIAEGDEPEAGDKTSVTQYSYSLDALPVQLFMDLLYSFLIDNQDNPQLRTLLEGDFLTRFQGELIDLAFNGTADDASDGFLTLNKGWFKLAKDAALATKVTIPVGSGVAATLSTGVVASNNALTFSAVQKGVNGNAVAVRFVNPAANSQALAVTVSGNTVTVSLATDGAGALTSTAAQVITAVGASAAASALVTVASTTDSTGVGVVAAFPFAYLEGGRTIGWIDALAMLIDAMPDQFIGQAAFMMSSKDALAYGLEIGKHVTGKSEITDPTIKKLLGIEIIDSPFIPRGHVLYTPPKNLVVGMAQEIRRGVNDHSRKRVIEYTWSAWVDFTIAVNQAVVLGLPPA